MTKQRALLIILLLGIITLSGAAVSILVAYLMALLPSWLTAGPRNTGVLLAVLVALSAFLSYWVYRLQAGSGKNKPRLTPQNRRNLLTKVCFHITYFFEDSLHGAALLVLSLQQEPDAVAHPWGLHLQHQGQPERNLPPGTHIRTAFQEAGRALLILGNPGAGKSTLLYELASDLTSLAEADQNQPVPVIFTLASWAVDRKPLDEWMVEALKQRYQVPTKIAQAWVQSDLLLPLLDGLDEVERSHRTACVEAINTYRKAHDVSLVVSCRREDYEELEQRLHLHTAVLIQPLTPAQIDEYLANAQGQLEAVRLALHDAPTLQALAASPLMLSVIALAYRGTPVDDLLKTPPAERQHHLFQTYIDRMLAWKPSNRFSPEPALHWLGWLAAQLTRQSQTEFYLEQMQSDWLRTPRSRFLYRTAVGLFFGLLFGLIFGLFFWLLFGLFFGSGFGLLVGLVAGLIGGLVAGLVFWRTTVALLLGEVEARGKNILKYLKQRQIRLELCRNLL